MFCYVDSIRSTAYEEQTKVLESFYVTVVLHSADSVEENELLSIVVPRSSLKGENGKDVTEGCFVEYNNLTNVLQWANQDSRARKLRALFAYYRDILLNDARISDYKEGQSNRNADVKSYHVNVGHGNCSVISATDGNNTSLYMIDCSVKESFSFHNYSCNLDRCILDIASALGVALNKFRLDYFLLTHHHYDHYNGMEYLIDQGYINRDTLLFMNLHYDNASPTMVRIMRKLVDLGVKIVEPIRGAHPEIPCHSPLSPISVLFPECRIYRNRPRYNPGIRYRIESKANYSSAVYCLSLGGKQMILPGDLEQEGFASMTKGLYCKYPFFECNYYCVSHHGSDNGHVELPCYSKGPFCKIIDCIMQHMEYAILMGRDGAYPGIYSTKVINDFGDRLIMSEKDISGKPTVYTEIQWRHSRVIYHY